MFEDLLNPDVQKFIFDHENDDARELALGQKEILGVSASTIATQILGRKKAKEKLPGYFHQKSIVYPSSVNLEQSSSEISAQYKIDIIRKNLPRLNSSVDLTGGFGVDSLYLSKIFAQVEYVEPDRQLLEIARHNHRQLHATTLSYHHQNAEAFLDSSTDRFDLIFIDPSRRVSQTKVASLAQSEPNILALQDKLFAFSEHVLVKASPMLDIKLAINDLKNVSKVFVLAISNEVKELLLLCQKDFWGEPRIITANILADQTENSEFFYSEEEKQENTFSDPLQFLYEPNASILKAGPFKIVSSQYNITKIAPSTHYYTSDILIHDFPGRVFRIERFVKPHPSIRNFFPQGKANVTTRNYPLTPDQLKKKTKLNDGGDLFLIGFSAVKKKFVVIATRLK